LADPSYNGFLSGPSATGRAEEAYFARLSTQGGINGRQNKFITLDDLYFAANIADCNNEGFRWQRRFRRGLVKR
jgi:hypothetical protein